MRITLFGVVLLLASAAFLISHSAAAQTFPAGCAPSDFPNHPIFGEQLRACQNKGWDVVSIANGAICYCDVGSGVKSDGDSSCQRAGNRCRIPGSTGSFSACGAHFGISLQYLPEKTEENADHCFVSHCPNGLEPSGVNMTGATACACPAGSAINSEGRCVACADNNLGYDPNSDQCVECGNREILDSTTGQCQECGIREEVKNNQCVSCGAGYRINPASGSCEACGSGERVNAQGQCEECPAGEFVSASADPLSVADACVATCPDGSVSYERQCVSPMQKCNATPGWWDNNDIFECRFENADGQIRDVSATVSTPPYLGCVLAREENQEPPEQFFYCDEFGDNLDFPPLAPGVSYVFNCDPEGTRGLIPADRSTVAESCGCGEGNTPLGEGDDKYCYPDFAEFRQFSDAILCEYFGGDPTMADSKICSGVDTADTFCLLESAGAFSCKGLLDHVRMCNEDFDRSALNPFLCGPECPTGQAARGGECES